MSKKLLSICIPVYNRKNVFKYCILKACEAAINHSEEVEIVVSDNHSEDDLETIVNEMIDKFPLLDIKYHMNDENIGPCRNFLKVAELAEGEFCWIVGSDDFIKADGIDKVLDILHLNQDIDFICCNFDYIHLDQCNVVEGKYIDLSERLTDKSALLEHPAPVLDEIVDKLEALITPKYNNVYLGAVMSGIFHKKIWNQVDKNEIHIDGFNNLESIYPHCFIYAQAFIHKKAYYCGKPVITVGEGTREWADDLGQSFWDSSLPLIYFQVFGEIIEAYRKNGFGNENYLKCKRATAFTAGWYFIPILLRKHIIHKRIKDSDVISLVGAIKLYWMVPRFYYGVIRSILSAIKRNKLWKL
jgi:glycosyltransferase involved in cell wall biosynthesis